MKMDMQQVTTSCSILDVEALILQKKRSRVLVERHDKDDNHIMTVKQIIESMATSWFHYIAFASKEFLAEEQMDDQGYKVVLKEKGSTLLGLVGLKDPCRP
ncbi:hypothetical protein DVH24_013256 [Malus domestica]|uniref:Uncharacterized protein n=1 Tax=Malus domestica TaxID=3750 RepID=A0A498HIG5_MALDO|nr:hypothetical protein DVH24_013256 [Malus domestica]